MKIGNRLFTSTAVIGILNLTPDSFSDGGTYSTIHQAIKRAGIMLAEGAQIIDVGGESTRPGFVSVSTEEECTRVLPVVAELCTKYDVPVSVDTTKAEVAEQAILQGADMINCVFYNDDIARVAAATGVPLVLTQSRDLRAKTDDFWKCFVSDIEDLISRAKTAGVSESKLLLDPGIGFGKTDKQCLETLNRLSELVALGFPVVVGASRKSLLGAVLKRDVSERLFGTVAVSALAAHAGAAFVRVHDVRANVDAVRIARAIKGEYDG